LIKYVTTSIKKLKNKRYNNTGSDLMCRTTNDCKRKPEGEVEKKLKTLLQVPHAVEYNFRGAKLNRTCKS